MVSSKSFTNNLWDYRIAIFTRCIFIDLLSISSNWWLQCPSIINCRNLPRQMELTLRSFFIRLNKARSLKTPIKQKGILEVFALLLVALRLYGYLHLSLHLKLSLWSEPILFLIKCWTWLGEQLKENETVDYTLCMSVCTYASQCTEVEKWQFSTLGIHLLVCPYHNTMPSQTPFKGI